MIGLATYLRISAVCVRAVARRATRCGPRPLPAPHTLPGLQRRTAVTRVWPCPERFAINRLRSAWTIARPDEVHKKSLPGTVADARFCRDEERRNQRGADGWVRATTSTDLGLGWPSRRHGHAGADALGRPGSSRGTFTPPASMVQSDMQRIAVCAPLTDTRSSTCPRANGYSAIVIPTEASPGHRPGQRRPRRMTLACRHRVKTDPQATCEN